MNIELRDVPVQSLVPEGLQDCATGAEYMAELPKYDGGMATALAEACRRVPQSGYVGACARVNLIHPDA